MISAHDYLTAPLELVESDFARIGCADGVRFVPGFVEDTMPGLRGRRWSVVRLDGDTYKATRLTLEALKGGYVVLDNCFFLPACRRAVDDFRREHGIGEPIEQIDWNGARWRNESEPTPAADAEDAAPPSRAGSRRESLGRSDGPIPTDREFELEDELAALQARLWAVENELEQLRSSPLAGPLSWARGSARRRA